MTLGGLIDRCGGAAVTWVDDDFLLGQEVSPYSELPLWVPPAAGSLAMPIDRALAAGLRHRGLDETICDVRAWAASVERPPVAVDAGGRTRRPATLTLAREAELLRRWHETHR